MSPYQRNYLLKNKLKEGRCFSKEEGMLTFDNNLDRLLVSDWFRWGRVVRWRVVLMVVVRWGLILVRWGLVAVRRP